MTGADNYDPDRSFAVLDSHVIWSLDFLMLTPKDIGKMLTDACEAWVNGNPEPMRNFPGVTKLVFRAKLTKPFRYVTAEDRRDVLAAGACVTCGATERLTVDHIKPVARGGGNERSNLQCMCRPCNSRKGARI